LKYQHARRLAMMGMLFRVAAVVAIAGAVACDRPAETVEQTAAPAMRGEPGSIEESSAAGTTPPQQGETPDGLPETAGALPLALSIAAAALGGALIMRLRRRGQ
jgi:hypothetical protein